MKNVSSIATSAVTLLIIAFTGLADGLPSEKYARVIRNPQGVVTSFETAHVHLRSQNNPTVLVDLIGAVHIADRTYYESLNKKFTHYDAVLYELIAEPGVKLRKGSHSSALSEAQSHLKDFLQLSFQLDEVNYQASNFVHADLSPQEFTYSMAQKGETFSSMLLSLATEASLTSSSSISDEAQGLKVLLSLISPRRSLVLKRTLSEELARMDSLMTMFVEKNNESTILTVRNKRALSVLDSEITKGKKHLAIFYGAAHLPDLERRLTSSLGFKRISEDWEIAWKLGD